MNRTRRTSLTCAAIAMVLTIAAAAAGQPTRTEDVSTQLEKLRVEKRFTFCKDSPRWLDVRQRQLCSLASEIDDCKGFEAACSTPQDEPSSTDGSWLRILGEVGRVLVWLLVIGVLAAIALPLLRVLLRARRDRQLADVPGTPNKATSVAADPKEPERISDAEAALAEADARARQGDFKQALSLYLGASLAALDRRGAIRLARHRTNGEYVRSCGEGPAQAPLREIVREVDRIEFGNAAATREGVARVAAHAAIVVRARSIVAASLATFVLLVCVGCGGFGQRNALSDPAGDTLPTELLRRSGYDVSYLTTSMATLPMPAEHEAAPIVLLDVTRVAIEDEAAAHLIRWVEAGGVLVLFGSPARWPKELHAESAPATGRTIELQSSDDENDEEPIVLEGTVAEPHALTWPASDLLATIGTGTYAARKYIGQGAIVGVAGTELLTNVGTSIPANAEILVALFDEAARTRTWVDGRRGVTDAPASYALRIAREQDGVSPPTNPFSALEQAGLGKASWHALAAALVLFLAYGIRHARAAPSRPTTRRAFAEHVEATGAFYGRSRAFAHALAAYGRFAEMRVRERMARTGDPIAFLAEGAHVSLDEAERVWKRATEASADDPLRGDELATIRDLRAMLVRALHGSADAPSRATGKSDVEVVPGVVIL